VSARCPRPQAGITFAVIERASSEAINEAGCRAADDAARVTEGYAATQTDRAVSYAVRLRSHAAPLIVRRGFVTHADNPRRAFPRLLAFPPTSRICACRERPRVRLKRPSPTRLFERSSGWYVFASIVQLQLPASSRATTMDFGVIHATRAEAWKFTRAQEHDGGLDVGLRESTSAC
jgi:hypothetical protein